MEQTISANKMVLYIHEVIPQIWIMKEYNLELLIHEGHFAYIKDEQLTIRTIFSFFLSNIIVFYLG